jgi:hypothetical protein
VQVRLGVYTAVTGADGLATLEVAKGAYELHAWKTEYEIPSRKIEVTDDCSIVLEAKVAPEPELEYWM